MSNTNGNYFQNLYIPSSVVDRFRTAMGLPIPPGSARKIISSFVNTSLEMGLSFEFQDEKGTGLMVAIPGHVRGVYTSFALVRGNEKKEEDHPDKVVLLIQNFRKTQEQFPEQLAELEGKLPWPWTIPNKYLLHYKEQRADSDWSVYTTEKGVFLRLSDLPKALEDLKRDLGEVESLKVIPV